ncbi:hypothetical protein Trydic_g19039 [Trypoxylus dichotomus]
MSSKQRSKFTSRRLCRTWTRRVERIAPTPLFSWRADPTQLRIVPTIPLHISRDYQLSISGLVASDKPPNDGLRIQRVPARRFGSHVP